MAFVALETWKNQFHRTIQDLKKLDQTSNPALEQKLENARNQIQMIKTIVDRLNSRENIFLQSEDDNLDGNNPLYRIISRMDPKERDAMVSKYETTLENIKTRSNGEPLTKSLEQKSQGNGEMDARLERVSDGVTHLREIAIDIGKELDHQNRLIPEIQTKSDMIELQMALTQSKVEKAIERTKKGRLLLYTCLGMPLLVMWAYLFRMISE